MMSLPKRYAYRRKCSNTKKKKEPFKTIIIKSSPKNVSPESNYPTVATKRTMYQGEIKGLIQKQLDKRPYKQKDAGNRLIHWYSLKILICEHTQCINTAVEYYDFLMALLGFLQRYC